MNILTNGRKKVLFLKKYEEKSKLNQLTYFFFIDLKGELYFGRYFSKGEHWDYLTENKIFLMYAENKAKLCILLWAYDREKAKSKLPKLLASNDISEIAFDE